MLGCVVGLLSVDRGGVSSGGLSGESCVVLLGGVSGACGLVIQRCSKQTFAMKPLALQGTEVRSTKGRFIKLHCLAVPIPPKLTSNVIMLAVNSCSLDLTASVCIYTERLSLCAIILNLLVVTLSSVKI